MNNVYLATQIDNQHISNRVYYFYRQCRTIMFILQKVKNNCQILKYITETHFVTFCTQPIRQMETVIGILDESWEKVNKTFLYEINKYCRYKIFSQWIFSADVVSDDTDYCYTSGKATLCLSMVTLLLSHLR